MDPRCGCCQGGLEGEVDNLCEGCFEAIVDGRRDGHPHDLSPEQQALKDADPNGGGIEWSGGKDV
jgi:hypothetical protein